VRIVRVAPQDRRTSADAIFIGEVATRAVVSDDQSRLVRAIEVHFHDGARNRMHTHTTDQVLVVTEGTAVVGTRSETHDLTTGDVAFIPAGEEHWHGAKRGTHMTHLAINGHGSETKVTE
jgi:quercetin dioxygenase-like cupin family protein